MTANVFTAAQTHATIPGVAARRIVRRAMTGTVWLLTASMASRLMTFGTSIVLARLLGPNDFGLVSFSMVAIGAVSLLQDLGVPAALIYGGQPARDAGGTALTINVAAALLLWLVLLAAAPMLATLGGHAEIQPIIVVLGLGLIISSLGSVQIALLARALAFKKKLIPDLVPLLASGATSIVLAYSGFGAWSLVWGYVTRSMAATATLWAVADVRFAPGFDWRIARHLLAYGKHVSASSLIGFAVNNVDYLIVGVVLGSYYLGLYTMAFVLGNVLAVFAQALADVSFPTLSLLKSDVARMVGIFDRSFSIISMGIGLLMLNMLVLAPTYAPIVLGESWAAVVSPLMVLTVFSAIRSLGILYAPVFKALGRPDLVWKFALIRLAVATPVLYWSATVGIVAVAVSQAVLVAAYLPLHWVLLRRLSSYQHRPWMLLLPTVLGLGVCGTIVALAREQGWLDIFATSPLIAAVVAALLSLVYCLLLAVAQPALAREVWVRGYRLVQDRRRGPKDEQTLAADTVMATPLVRPNVTSNGAQTAEAGHMIIGVPQEERQLDGRSRGA
jgi:lipopolysaccharide exporter